jgi:hypothetical protein
MCFKKPSHNSYTKKNWEITFDARISRWIIGWTEADRTTSLDTTLGVQSTARIGARIGR